MSYAVDSGTSEEDIKEIAPNYWSGVPHPDENLWEYFAPFAIILKVEPFDTFSMEP